MNKQTEPVLEARLQCLKQAKLFLRDHGIDAKHTSPKKSAGLLKVSPENSNDARDLLRNWVGQRGRIITAAEAALFVCQNCHATLSLGSHHCPTCGTLVGDPHGH